MIACGVLVAGCDRQKAADGQEAAPKSNVSPAKAGPTAAAPADTAFAHVVDRSRAGRAAPLAEFIGPDDAAVTLADFRGRPVLVNLWATWCPPCLAEMPTLDTLAERTDGQMAVLAVAQDVQGAAVVDPWFARAGLTRLTPYLDPENGLLDAVGAPALPVTVLYDARGREVWRVTGALDWSGAEARGLLAESGVRPR
ncbi:MAG: hypothetical protein RLZZ58_329 [Pseudomonadota bacterium]